VINSNITRTVPDRIIRVPARHDRARGIEKVGQSLIKSGNQENGKKLNEIQKGHFTNRRIMIATIVVRYLCQTLELANIVSLKTLS
jgi:hypothetical protein